MSDPTQDILKKMLEYLETTESFMVEQTPDFILQLLRYKFLESILGFIVFLVIAILGFYFGRTLYSSLLHKHMSEDRLIFLGVISFSVLVVLLSSSPEFGIPDFIKIWIAPKLYLVEYVRGML